MALVSLTSVAVPASGRVVLAASVLWRALVVVANVFATPIKAWMRHVPSAQVQELTRHFGTGGGVR
jgi:hypothetical protein